MKKTRTCLSYFGGVVLAFGILAASVGTAFAAEFIVPEGDNGNVTVTAESEHKNLYVVGANVLVNSKISGDLYVAGGNVTVEGDVESDIDAAGGTVYLNGLVGGDVRVLGGNITINNAVAGDLVIMGGTVTVSEKATVGGDVIVLGGEVNLQSAVAGRLLARTDRFTLNGPVAGPADIQSNMSVEFGQKASVGSGSKYKAPKEAEISNAETLGSINYEVLTIKQGQRNAAKSFTGIMTIGFLIKLIAMIIAALVLYKLLPKTSQKLVEATHDRFWHNLLIGFLFLVVGPIAFVILLLVFVGFYSAIILLVAWILILILAALLAQVYTGAWLMKYFTKKETLHIDWQAIVIGTVVLSLVALIPFIGWLIMAILFLVATGAMLRMLYHVMQSQQTSAMVE